MLKELDHMLGLKAIFLTSFFRCVIIFGLWFVLPAAAQVYVQPTKLANRLFPTNQTSTYANGTSVAMYGDTLVVGDPVAGAAYVFNRNAGGQDRWGQVRTLSPDSPGSGFGTAVACDGPTIIVGSPNERAAYAFSGGGSVWSRNDKIEMYYQFSFGGAVAVKGDFVLVGAPHGYTTSGAGMELDAGAAYLFHRNTLSPNSQVGGQGSGWGVVANAPNAEGNLHGGGVTLFNAAGNHFGTAVALSDSFIAVGSPDAEPGANPNLGLVSIFHRKNVGGTNYWEYTFPLDDNVRTSGGRFGYSLALTGNKLTVGAPDQNRAYAYNLTWVPFGERGFRRTATFVPPDGMPSDDFGSAVGFDGSDVAATAPGHVLPIPFAPTAPGAVYTFSSSGSFHKKLLYGGCDLDAKFGVSVAVSSGVVAVGATNKPPNTARGSVWLSEGVSDDLKVRWIAPGGGVYTNTSNWSPPKVPAACDVVELKDTSATPTLRQINLRVYPDHEPPSYDMAQLIVDSGKWSIDANRHYIAPIPVKGGLNISKSIDDYGEMSFVNAAVSTPEVLVGTGGTLSLYTSDLSVHKLLLFPQSTLRVDGITPNGTVGTTLRVTNLTIGSECRLGWRNASIEVQNDLMFSSHHVLNIEVNPSDAGSEVPLFKVAPGREFKAGGRLNFIKTGQDALAAGQRFRLVEFTTDNKSVDDIYRDFRFKDYNPETLAPNLIWGLAYREDSISGKQFLELLVLKKPRRDLSTLPPIPGKRGLVFVTHGTASGIDVNGIADGAFGEIAHGIQVFLTGKNNFAWDVVTFDWSEFDTEFLPRFDTYNAATSAQIGIGIAESLQHWMKKAGYNYQEMHLLSHSSGTWLINRMRQLHSQEAVQLTLFDAFTNPGKSDVWPFGDRFSAILGAGAGANDFVEHYVDRSTMPPGTGDILANAMNFDVTEATITSFPSNHNVGIPVLAQHAWPYVWYLETVRFANGTVSNLPSAYCAGFLLSPEFLESTTNQPQFDFMRSYKTTLTKGQTIRIINRTCDEGPLPSVLESYPSQFNIVSFAPVGTYGSTADGGVSMTTGLAVSGPVPPNVDKPQEGPVPSSSRWAAITNLVFLPHWATEFAFDYQFSGTATGLLTVIVDGSPVGVLDQSFVGTNLLTTDGIPLNPKLSPGLHRFVFYLESTSNEHAGVTLSNLQFAYDPHSVIVAQRVLTNGNVELTLQGIPNRAYTIERALTVTGPWMNLGVALTGTNGLSVFTDTNFASTSMFYRAKASEPTVLTQFQSQTNVSGNNIVLTANVYGTPTLYYQWLKDGVQIAGATNSTLSLPGLTTNQSGLYSVVVSNSHGVAEGQIVNLTVLVPPAITQHPLAWARLIGDNVSLTANAIGSTPLSYQWRKNGLSLTDTGSIAGASTTMLAITNLQLSDQATYDFVVSNAGGSATSYVATLTIMPLSESEIVTGVTATATSELASFGRYASNAVNGVYFDGNFWESIGFVQGVGDGAPAITFDLKQAHPLASFVIWNGHEPGRAVKRMEVQVSSEGTNFQSLGEMSLAITTGQLMSETNGLNGVKARFVRFAILENWGSAEFPTTNPAPANAMVAIDEVEFYRMKLDQNPPVITSQPVNQILSPGRTVQMSTTATGTPPLAFQWRRGGVALANGGNVTGATTAMLSLTNVQAGDVGNYDVIVTNHFGSVSSYLAKLILPPPVGSSVVTGVTATATSELPQPFGRWASNTVNGTSAVWESVGVDQGFGVDRDPAITFDLHAVRFLEKFIIWNGPEPGPSVKRMRVEVSLDGQNFVSLNDLALPNITTAQTNFLGVETRYVRFHILENWAGQGRSR